MTTATATVGQAAPSQLGNPADCRIGRKEVHVQIDFSLGNTFTLDLSQIQSQGVFDCVQTLYVDNRNGTDTLIITTGTVIQNVSLPVGAQGYIPILQSNPPVITFQVASGTPKIDVFCLNFFVPPSVWYTQGLPVTDLTLKSVIQNGGVNVNVNPATVMGPNDASSTITVGGTPQVLFAANAARKRFTICNPSTATEILQFSYVSNTGGRIDLPIGATWNEADFSVSGDEIWIVGATAGHAFTAYQW